MKFAASWLKRHLDTDADAATIARTLTALGLEIEGVTDASAALAALDGCLTTLAVIWPLLGRYLAVTWSAFGRYLAVMWPICGRYLGPVRHLTTI